MKTLLNKVYSHIFVSYATSEFLWNDAFKSSSWYRNTNKETQLVQTISNTGSQAFGHTESDGRFPGLVLRY